MSYAQCHLVTEEIEKLLGKVVYTTPTAEQFEEKVTITQTQQDTLSPGTGGNAQNNNNKWGQY